MTIKVIQERFRSYHCVSADEEDNAIKEITQELILCLLSQADFFKKVAFLGGTSLRILYGLLRFSEDLDFSLLKADPSFDLHAYLDPIADQMSAYGYDISVSGRSRGGAVQAAFLKDDSLGRILTVSFPKTSGPKKTIKIKLEVDTNPPAHANIELKYQNFPIAYTVAAHDMGTLFAGKSHALLSRKYLKGRDWFDFLWYIGKKTAPNYLFLASALAQSSPEAKHTEIDLGWYEHAMRQKIRDTDWEKAKADVFRFLTNQNRKSLDLWNKDFFDQALDRLVADIS